MDDNAEDRPGLVRYYHSKLWKKLDKFAVFPGELWYRGQRYYKWKLESGANQRVRKKSTNFNTVLGYVEDLLETVKLRGWNEDAFGRKLSDLKILARLQHSGAATCLLDFTLNFNIALWFACQNVGDNEVKEQDRERPRNGKVFVVRINEIFQTNMHLCKVHSYELEKRINYFLNPNVVREFDPDLQNCQTKKEREVVQNVPMRPVDPDASYPNPDLGPNPRFWYWDPGFSIGRMASQASRFLFGPKELSQCPHLKKVFYFEIDVKEKHKDKLRHELEIRYGLRPDYIFPDMQGFASANDRYGRYYPQP